MEFNISLTDQDMKILSKIDNNNKLFEELMKKCEIKNPVLKDYIEVCEYYSERHNEFVHSDLRNKKFKLTDVDILPMKSSQYTYLIYGDLLYRSFK